MSGRDETWRAARPFPNEHEALTAADRWRHVDVSPYDNDLWRQAMLRAAQLRLREAIDRTGTPCSAYEHQILDYLARDEPATVEILASLVERAYEAGARDATEGGAS